MTFRCEVLGLVRLVCWVVQWRVPIYPVCDSWLRDEKWFLGSGAYIWKQTSFTSLIAYLLPVRYNLHVVKHKNL